MISKLGTIIKGYAFHKKVIPGDVFNDRIDDSFSCFVIITNDDTMARNTLYKRTNIRRATSLVEHQITFIMSKFLTLVYCSRSVLNWNAIFYGCLGWLAPEASFLV